MTENIAIDGCLSVGCTLFIYSWGAPKHEPLAPITSDIISHWIQTFVYNLQRYLAA